MCQSVVFAPGGNRIRRWQFCCGVFRRTTPALSVLAGYRPDRDTAPLQLRIHGWIERFLLCARLDIVAACAARRQVVVAVARAVAVAAFGVYPRVLGGAVGHAHCRGVGHETRGGEWAVAEHGGVCVARGGGATAQRIS